MSENLSTPPKAPRQSNPLGLLFGLYVCMQILIVLFIMRFFKNETTPSTNIDYLYWLIILATQTIGSFFIPVFIWARVYKQHLTMQSMMGFRFPIHFKVLFWSIVLLVANYPIMDLLVSANTHFIASLSSEMVTSINAMYNAQSYFFANLFTIPLNPVLRTSLLVLVIGLIPAICEELFFRAALQKILTQRMNSKMLAILLTALIFSIVHMEFYGFLLRFGMGFFLGFVFFKTNNIIYSIVLHFLFNASQVVMMSLSSDEEIRSSIQEKSSYIDEYPLWASLAILVSLVATYFIYEQWRKAIASKV